MRGLWISYGDFYDLGLANKSQVVYTANLKKAFVEAKKYGVNTVYFHVRAFDDATWKSSTFKASSSLTSDASANETARETYSYDPLQIAITLAHQQGMELHAWINPYRISISYFYDPAFGASQRRVITAIKELSAYNIDGIHLDDYFYHAAKGYKKITAGEGKPNPTTAESIPTSNVTKKRNYVNTLIAQAYTETHKKSARSFGISPAGNYENCMNDGADVTTWLSKKGYVDYLVPQIYWTDQWGSSGKTTMFTNRMNQFKNANKLGIPMYAGLALYRTGFAQSDDKGWGWKNNNLATQVSKLRAAKLNGFVLFSGTYLFESKCASELTNLKNYLYPPFKTISASGITLKSYNCPTTLIKGAGYGLKGTLSSSKTFKRVEVGIVKKSTGKYVSGHYYNKTGLNAKTFDVANAKTKLAFNTLPAGTYYYRIWVHPTSGSPVRVINRQFTVITFTPKLANATKPSTLKKGSYFTIKGTVTANTTIKRVEVGVVSKSTKKYVAKCYYNNTNVNAKSFNVARADSSINFDKLARGGYYYRIWVHPTAGKAVCVCNKGFTVY
ncbi:MAG: glycoside hydrolase family 10 protein [Coriobacteriales bacterium]